MYSFLKELDCPINQRRQGKQIPTHEDYNISKDEFIRIVELLKEGKYIKNDRSVDRKSYIGMRKYLKTAVVTLDGINFLKGNNRWSKCYKGLKEVRDWLPL